MMAAARFSELDSRPKKVRPTTPSQWRRVKVMIHFQLPQISFRFSPRSISRRLWRMLGVGVASLGMVPPLKKRRGTKKDSWRTVPRVL